MTSGGRTRDVVVISLEAWDAVWRRNQYLVDGLLSRDPLLRVLFVEPAHDRLHDLLARRVIEPGRGARVHESHDGRLMLFQPTKTLPRMLGPAADASWRRQVLRETARRGMVRPVVWVNDAQGAQIVAHRDWPSLYDITDDWLEASRPPRVRRRLERDERMLLERCREVVVCSPALAASRGGARPVRLIPNAVDVARYRRPAPRPGDLPEHAAVYAGTAHEDRLDIALLARTARQLQGQGTVVLLGPDALAASSRADLVAAGVVLLGPRPHLQVPAYLQHAAALIVPHVVDGFTDSLDPIKLYEYRAVGRPIVSTPVAGFRDSAAPALTIAQGDGFAAAVRAALEDDAAAIPDRDVPDWSQRVADMADVLEAVRAADADAEGR